MANWEEIKVNVGKAANKTAKKAGELADIAALHIKVKTLNVKLNEKFKKLGKLTYKQLKSNITQADAISLTVDEIDELFCEIKELKEKIEEAKKSPKSDEVELDCAEYCESEETDEAL